MSEPRREQCEHCEVVHEVTERGAMVVHGGLYGWQNRGTTALVTGTICRGSGRMSKQERARRVADRKHAKHRDVLANQDDARVALDAFIEGRAEFADRIKAMCDLALFQYREQWSVAAVHPFRYETREKPENRRAMTVTIDGEEYAIVDIGMRMLTPRELFRANGTDDDVVIDPMWNGKPITKTDQIRLCGNMVPPQWAEELIAANFGEAA